MLRSLSPINFGISRTIFSGKDLGVRPLVPKLSLVRDLPNNPYDYPDAWKLPRLPLPLAMRVGKFTKMLATVKMNPLPSPKYYISGITKDSVGAALASCDVDVLKTSGDIITNRTTSDSVGYFRMEVYAPPPTAFYLVAYKTGSPDVAGTSVNTITGG